MEIVKPVGVIVADRKYLVSRDADESFFKNIGGRTLPHESDYDCLRRTLSSHIGFILSKEPPLIFDLPPTPAQGDPGDTVLMRGYHIDIGNHHIPDSTDEVAEFAWINMHNRDSYTLTPQIRDLILPRLKELNLID